MRITRAPHGVILDELPEEACDENLPGEIHLSWDDAKELYWQLSTLLRLERG